MGNILDEHFVPVEENELYKKGYDAALKELHAWASGMYNGYSGLDCMKDYAETMQQVKTKIMELVKKNYE